MKNGMPPEQFFAMDLKMFFMVNGAEIEDDTVKSIDQLEWW